MQIIKFVLIVAGITSNCLGNCDGFNWYHDINVMDCDPADIKTLEGFIENSGESLEMDMDVNFNGKVEVIELGWQLWEDGRLVHWICQDVPSPWYFYEYDCGLSGEIPEEIGNLNALIKLRIQDNFLNGNIPESICNLKIKNNGPYWFNLGNNHLCPPYPDCVENAVGKQTTSNCK